MDEELSGLAREVIELERENRAWRRSYERELTKELSKQGFFVSSGTYFHAKDGRKHPYFHIADKPGMIGVTFPTLNSAVFFPRQSQVAVKEFRDRLSSMELLFTNRGYHVNEFVDGDLVGAINYAEDRI